MSILTYILLCPLLGALILVCLPSNYRFLMRLGALVATFGSLILSVVMFFRFQSDAGWQFVQKVAWVPQIGINYHVGVDGINIGLILMSAVVAFAAACVSWEIKTQEKEYYILLLLMSTGILGAFASLDLFLFYFFHELALVPTFIMIGLWGRGENRQYATFKITLYLSLGALIALVGLIMLYVETGSSSFDMIELAERARLSPMESGAQNFIYPWILFGLGILVSLWPFHTWAPLGYGSAPTATAMLHAGALKKFGLYGLLRVTVPILPEAAQNWAEVLACLCLGNIVYCGFVAMRQKDLNLLIGNSSVAHMGFAFLGIASFSLLGITGAVLVMVAHGFLAALTFAISGYLYQHSKTLRLDEFGGVLRQTPFIGLVLVIAMMAGCGMPGFANFVGEISVIFGAWDSFTFVTVLAVWGALVIGGVYMLRAIRAIAHGPISPAVASIPDANYWRRVPFVLLVGALLLFGVMPSLLTEKIRPSVEELLRSPVTALSPVAGPLLVESALKPSSSKAEIQP